MAIQTHLDAIASLLDQGAADSAVRLLRGAWEPELPPDRRVPMYRLWIRGLCEMGEFDQARTLAVRATAEFPRDVDLLIALGNVHDLRGELEDARDAFARATELDPTSAMARYDLGTVLERLGDSARAESHYRDAIAADETGALLEAQSALGALLRQQGRIDEAEETYAALLEEDPVNVEALVEHGICLSDLGRFEEAFERFESALALDPEHAPASYNKAVTLFRVGRMQAAIEAMRTAHGVEPENPLTLAVLGSWLMHTTLFHAAGVGEAPISEAARHGARAIGQQRQPAAVDPDPEATLDEALGFLYGAVAQIEQLEAAGEVGNHYAGMVVEEVFEALWQHDRRGEARALARQAAQRDWITPHMLETMNRADQEDHTERSDDAEAAAPATYRVIARAMPTPEFDARPEHWPADAHGFETDLEVVARDEREACELTSQWLRSIEPQLPLRVDVRVVGRIGTRESASEATREDPAQAPLRPARGVARVESSRAWLRD